VRLRLLKVAAVAPVRVRRVVHLLVSLSEDVNIKKLIRNWKHWTAQNFRFRWQRDFFKHRLRSDQSLDEKVAYIWENPVRAALVAKPEDWPYRFVSGVTA
jgi:REP element-mobilizing transposase RayT